MITFDTIFYFQGYQNKHDITSYQERLRLNRVSPFIGLLVTPSQNVLFGDDGIPAVRKGFTLDGSANASLVPITSNKDWKTSSGTEQNLRFRNDGVLEYRYVAADGTVTYRTLMSGIATTAIPRFAEWWSDTEKEDEVLFVVGDSNIYEWSGAVATIASVGVNTLTIAGGGTWAASRFLTAGTRGVTINGVAYTYSGGESTATLTGVMADPSGAGIAAGDIVHQTVRTTAFSTFTKPGKFASGDKMDLIAVFNNQCLLAYTKSRYVFMSKQNDFTNYTPAATRVPGDADTYTLDGAIVGFATSLDAQNNQNAIYVTAGQDFWYQITYTKSADRTSETSDIKRLQSGPRQAAKSQELIVNLGTAIYFIAQDQTLLSVAQIQQPNEIPLSDPVKTDFDAYVMTNASLKYQQPYLHIVMPTESKIHPYNLIRKQWEAPQILPAGRLAAYSGVLYMHSNAVPESYKLFDGTSDNANPIYARMYFAYHNYGDRLNYKQFTVFATEGYISSNTIATLVLKYDFGGFRSIHSYPIDGSDPTNIFATLANNSLGKYPLGEQPIGSFTDSISGLAKFRHYKKVAPDRFFELQVGYEINQIDGQFKLLAHGANIAMADASPTNLIK